MNPLLLRRILQCLLCALACAAGSAHATYSCNVSVTDVGVIYATGNNTRTDVLGSVTITCTRDVTSDANTLSYRIGADNGANYANPNRRTRLGATNNYLVYSLTRGTAPGVGATCADTSNWDSNVFGANLMTGTLNFATSAVASATWSFCARVRGNQGNPTAGLYTDAVNVYAQYPGTLFGTISSPAVLNYTIGARNQCVLNTFPSDMSFDYSSFQTTAQVISQTFSIECSNGLPWTVTLSPTSGTLLGLNYSLALAPGSGSGNGNPQQLTITGTMPARQQGTCATATCSASNPHTVTVSY